MKNNERDMSNVTALIERHAYGSAPSEVAKLAAADIDNRFVVFRRSSFPSVSTSSGGGYLEAGEARRVHINSQPDDLREKAIGLLAIADLREKQIEAENEELAPYRIKAMVALGYAEDVDIYRYMGLHFESKLAVDQLVDSYRRNDVLVKILDTHGISVDIVTE